MRRGLAASAKERGIAFAPLDSVSSERMSAAIIAAAMRPSSPVA